MIYKNIRKFIKKYPLLKKLAKGILKFARKHKFTGSKQYWERRYSRGGNSGVGSTGKDAEFKARIINNFIKKEGIKAVIDFGCGDGNQLSLFKISHYIGLDVSRAVIEKNSRKFKDDKTKEFYVYRPEQDSTFPVSLKADSAISLDVIFHLVEDKVFEEYMRDLFQVSSQYVIIFSTNTTVEEPMYPWVRNRKFMKYVKRNFPKWKLVKKIKDKYSSENSPSKYFFIFERDKSSE